MHFHAFLPKSSRKGRTKVFFFNLFFLLLYLQVNYRIFLLKLFILVYSLDISISCNLNLDEVYTFLA